MLTGLSLILAIVFALLFIIIACSVLRWHPFLVLLGTALLLGIIVGLPADKAISTVIQGGSAVFGSIGIVIALGTILGEILERTGAATAIAKGIVRVMGEKRSVASMSTLGAITGIPVFCDSGFVILSNLARSLSRQTATSYGAISIALATGLYTTHVLVPPTPGPLAAAGNLGMANDLGWVILLGLVTGIPAIFVGYFFAKKIAKHIPPDTSEKEEEAVKNLPSIFRSLVPLLLPVLLIAGGSFLSMFKLPESTAKLLGFFFNPNVALLISVIVALLLLGMNHRKEWNGWIQRSLSQAGPIILITIAGGALGAVLKATPLSDEFNSLMQGKQLSAFVLFPVAYLLAAGLKTSQGSSTAALVIASSILAPLMGNWGLDHPAEKALLVMAIGAGAMTVSHANDSYFWVINQYSGITVPQMYRYFTHGTFWMGVSVLLTSMALALLF
jgi:gluconate:H+ symporter, GntP family